MHPRREVVPRRGVSDWNANLLDENQESSGPQGGAVNLARGPIVIDCQNKQESVGDPRCPDGVPIQESVGPAGNGSDDQTDRGDEDNAFMRGRAEARGTQTR